MTQTDAVLEQLTGSGGPFEIVVDDILGHPTQMYKQRMQSLRELMDANGLRTDQEWLVQGEQRYTVRPETTILIGRAAWHTVQNTGPGQMRLLWMIAPAGLEDWFRAIGRPRRPGEAMPGPFERPADVAEVQARMRFVREG